MNSGLKRLWAVVAMASVLCMLPATAGAAMVSTDQAIGRDVAQQERARVRAFLERSDAREQLRAMGVDELAAQDRVADLTDEEVHVLAQQLDTLPAGGDMSQNDIIVILLIVILVILLI